MDKIKVGDEVMVICGKDRRSTGKVMQIFSKMDQVLVEGVNKKKKSVKPTQEAPEGGFIEIERPIHISNIMVVSPKTKKPTRVRIVKGKDGKNSHREAVSCGSKL